MALLLFKCALTCFSWFCQFLHKYWLRSGFTHVTVFEAMFNLCFVRWVWTFSSSVNNGDDIELCNDTRIEGCSLLLILEEIRVLATFRIGDVCVSISILRVFLACVAMLFIMFKLSDEVSRFNMSTGFWY